MLNMFRGIPSYWKIENFSHWCAKVHGDCIESPQFPPFGTHMELYPKGISGQGEHLVVRLCKDAGSRLGFAYSEVSFFSSDGSLLCKQPVNGERNTNVLELPPGPKFEDVIFRIRESGDFITVRIRIVNIFCYEQRMCTTINVLKMSMEMDPGWIEKMGSDETSKVCNIYFSTDGKLLSRLYFHLTDGMELKICSKNNTVHFMITPPTEYEDPFAVEMCMRLTGSDGTVDSCIKKEHVFHDNSPWTFPDPLEKKELLGKEVSLLLCLKTRDLIQNPFYANCAYEDVRMELNNTLCFSTKKASTYPITSNKVEVFTKDSDMPADSVQVLSKQLMCAYRDEKFSDLVLKCDNVTFPVHKVVLSARSPVLDRLLSSDMKKAASGTLDIVDIDPSTLGLFLTYLYTGTLGELQCDRALKLYYAADKYQVPSLKMDCSKFLCAKVSISNVCDILSLADRHQDDKLTSASHDFILDNYNDVLKSKEWDTLKKNEPLLARNTVKKFAVKYRVRKRKPQ